MTTNLLLADLPASEYKRILPQLEEIPLTYGSTILPLGDPTPSVFFPNSGIISLLASAEKESKVITCVIGREGVAGGLCLFLGAEAAPVRAIVQGNGTAMRMKATGFVKECSNGGALSGMVMRFTYSLLVQLLQSSACYRYHPPEKRLARWLLMTSDRMQTSNFQMTQDFLANLVGVRREAVVGAARVLKKKELITYSRGQLEIIDRSGLEAVACGCYAIERSQEKGLSNCSEISH